MERLMEEDQKQENEEQEMNDPDSSEASLDPEAPAREAERVADADAAPPGVQAKLNEAYGKRDELQNKFLRAVADLDNLRKRLDKERREAAERTRSNLLGDMLPALDAFRLGLDDARKREEAKGVVEGFAMALTQLESVLGEHGLAVVDPTGEPFDHNLHEAIGHETSVDVEEGSVLTTVRVGYKLGERLLRAASVIISKGPDAE